MIAIRLARENQMRHHLPRSSTIWIREGIDLVSPRHRTQHTTESVLGKFNNEFRVEVGDIARRHRRARIARIASRCRACRVALEISR